VVYICKPHVCEPQCGGKTCGLDGCGGMCGKCEGQQLCGSDDQCHDPCKPASWAPAVQKVITLDVGQGGRPGEALDVDGDPETCAPADDCQDGLDNGMTSLINQINSYINVGEELAKALDEGDLVWLLEMPGCKTDGGTFEISILFGSPKDPKETCDFQAATCSFLVSPTSYDSATCQPHNILENAKALDSKLTAGGKDSTLAFDLSLAEDGASLHLPLRMVQLVADTGAAGDCNDFMLTNGIIGGAIVKAEMIAAVDLLPDDNELPVSKDMIKNMLEMLVKPDLDLDDDGTLDSVSIGLKFSSMPGEIAGNKPAE